MTIYIVLPPEKLATHAKLIRVWLGAMLVSLGRRRRAVSPPTLLLIDEAAQLGALEELRTAITLMRGYGVRCWTFWQDITQLMRTYPLDWAMIANNSSTQVLFGTTNPMAHRTLQEYLGHTGSVGDLKVDEAMLVTPHEMPKKVRRGSYLTDAMFRGTYDANPYAPVARVASAASPASGAENIVSLARRVLRG